MRFLILTGFMVLLFLLVSSRQKSQSAHSAIIAEIQHTLNSQVEGWNQGSIKKFMQGYWHSDSLRFASGGTVTYGWQYVFDRYQKKYSDPGAMGHLTFREIKITILSEDAALVFGKWQLTKEGAQPWGLFTLLVRRFQSGWQVVHDHTSMAVE